MPKLIREMRFGPAKQFKTGAVVGTYPKPLLLLSFDEEGHSVIPTKGQAQDPSFIKLDSTAEDIVKVNPVELRQLQGKPQSELPKITLVDFCDANQRLMTPAYVPGQNPGPMLTFMDALNCLVQFQCPWRTVVVDPVTGYTDIVLQHIASINLQLMADPRRWASMAGQKVYQMIGVVNQLKAHVVVILHSKVDKNELTGQTSEGMMVYSEVRQIIGGLASQIFYATKEGKKPVIWTTDRFFVKGVGARWPLDLPEVCAPDFKSIYGRELPNG